MTRLGLTAFLDGFALSGLFSRARWLGAPILGFAPSKSRREPESVTTAILQSPGIPDTRRPWKDSDRLLIEQAVERLQKSKGGSLLAQPPSAAEIIAIIEFAVAKSNESSFEKGSGPTVLTHPMPIGENKA